jgi:hypothetical protein
MGKPEKINQHCKSIVLRWFSASDIVNKSVG